MIARARSLIAVALLAASAQIAGPAAAADAKVRIYTATLNDFAAALAPLPPVTGTYRFRTCADLGILGTYCHTWCRSEYRVQVSGLSFGISPGAITATGSVAATWCGFAFSGNLNATGNALYSAGDGKVRFSFSSAAVQPFFSAFGFTVRLPVSINIAPTLAIPPMQIGVARVGYESASGPRHLTMQPRDVSLTKQSGYLELQSNLSFY